MSAAAIRRVASRYGLRVKRVKGATVEVLGLKPGQDNSGGENRPTWKLVLSQGGKRLLVVHYDDEDRAHSTAEVVDRRFATADGVRVGTSLRTLARLYGRGVIYRHGGHTAVSYEDLQRAVFMMDFFLEDGKRLQFLGNPASGVVTSPKAWKRLLQVNPRVKSIHLAGE